MLNLKPAFLVITSLGLAACGGKPQETMPPAPAATLDAATQAGVSTGSQLGVMLNAPGNYVRGSVANVDRAKQAAALANKVIEERRNSAPLTEPGY